MGLFGLGLTVRAMASGTACQVALTAWEKKRVPDTSRRRSWKLTSLKWETARETLVLLLVAVELCDVSFRVQATGNGPCRGSTRGSSESPATHQWTHLSTVATCAKRTTRNERRDLLARSMFKRSIVINE